MNYRAIVLFMIAYFFSIFCMGTVVVVLKLRIDTIQSRVDNLQQEELINEQMISNLITLANDQFPE